MADLCATDDATTHGRPAAHNISGPWRPWLARSPSFGACPGVAGGRRLRLVPGGRPGRRDAEPRWRRRPAHVSAVIDGDTVRLDDGREVRLVGIQAPKLPLGRAGYPTWPLRRGGEGGARGARARPRVEPRLRRRGDGPTRPRAGAALRRRRLWVQGEMVAPRLRPRLQLRRQPRAAWPSCWRWKREARAAGRGIWAETYYAMLSPAALEREAEQRVDSFQLVEGRVRRGCGGERRVPISTSAPTGTGLHRRRCSRRPSTCSAPRVSTRPPMQAASCGCAAGWSSTTAR